MLPFLVTYWWVWYRKSKPYNSKYSLLTVVFPSGFRYFKILRFLLSLLFMAATNLASLFTLLLRLLAEKRHASEQYFLSTRPLKVLLQAIHCRSISCLSL